MQLKDSKKVVSCSEGPVDFPGGQVTLKAHLPNGQRLKLVIFSPNH